MNFHLVKKIFIEAILLLSLSIMLQSCSTMTSVSSIWQIDKSNFDKNGTMWNGYLLYFPDEKLSVGIKNDNKNLYLCFKTADPANIRKALTHGLTIWFNNSDDKSKSFGIKYPEGIRSKNNRKIQDIEGSDKKESEISYRANKGAPDFKIPDELIFLIGYERALKKMSLLEANNKYRINVSMRIDDDILYYQLSVPFANSELKYSISANSGRNIGIGFETGEVKKPEGDNMPKSGGNIGMPGNGSGFPGGEGGSFPGGGMGGMGRGGMGGSSRNGQNPGGIDRASMEPLNLWLSVELAKK